MFVYTPRVRSVETNPSSQHVNNKKCIILTPIAKLAGTYSVTPADSSPTRTALYIQVNETKERD